jgi:hypothetical protein
MLALTLVLLLLWARVEERDQDSRPRTQPWWRRLLPSWKSLLLLAAFGLCYGLSMGTHLSNLGFAPAFALFVLLASWRTAISPPAIGTAGGGFLLGLLQFLWLPYKASSLTDRAMRANAPSSLQGIYKYTLGAFPQFRFAFPLAALPIRIAIYLDMLRQQFSLGGIGLGILGMWTLLWHKPKRFFLIVGMYLVHVWFFIQYRVFDLDVFFIPSHLLYAIFIGFGIYWLAERFFSLLGERRVWHVILTSVLTLVFALPLAYEVQANWRANDYSDDVAINDFYENAFELLPQGAALLGRSGVFGYDMFYYRLVYGMRPDVAMPHLPTADVQPEALVGRDIYTTMRLDDDQAGRGPWALPRDLIDQDAWYVPVLISGAAQSGFGARPLILYHITDTPPSLVVDRATPQVEIKSEVAGWVLVGYDLEEREISAGDTLHLTIYWRATQAPQRVLMSTMMGDSLLETHEVGLGNLNRYADEIQPPRNSIIVEDYQVVVPSTSEAGSVVLSIGVAYPLRQLGGETGWEAVVELGEITVLPRE